VRFGSAAGKYAATRLRGHKLQRIRAEHFRQHPLCVHCLKKDPPQYRRAAELDHVVALHNGGADFDRDGGKNRQGLCADCHKAKTAEDLGHKPFEPVPTIGPDGYPID
jgi:5-methylcytosine-specific restriction endonuclease McrA